MTTPRLPSDASTTALIVVDVQNGFVNDKSKIALAQIRRLIEHWCEFDRPIYFTKFLNLPGSNWERLIGWTRLRTSPETDFHEAIVEYISRGILVEKENLYTSITGRLALDVDAGDVKDAVICGIATESCVLATALRLFEIQHPGLRPIVVKDAVASHAGIPAHEAGLMVIERFIGREQVIKTADILREGD